MTAARQLSKMVKTFTDDQENQIGKIFTYTGSTPPPGHLALPTSATNVSRTTYAKLFEKIQTTWGAGDGSTTFGLPWCAANQTLIQSSGNVGTTTVGEVIAHTHDAIRAPGGTGAGPNFQGGSGYLPTYPSGSTGGSANLPAGSRVLFCIRFE